MLCIGHLDSDTVAAASTANGGGILEAAKSVGFFELMSLRRAMFIMRPFAVWIVAPARVRVRVRVRM